jgi:hypothetical protein
VPDDRLGDVRDERLGERSLCLVNTAAITGANTIVDVGGTVTISGPDISAGPNSPTAGTGWTNPTYVFANDANDAPYSVAQAANSAAQDTTGFGFAIPTSAIIRGISVSFMKKANTAGYIKDNSVYLLKAGAPSGNNKAAGGYWGTSDSPATTYGSSSDLWGTTWTAAQINASNFGVRMIAHNDDSAAHTARLNYISITVTYTNDTNGIGASGANILKANITGTCTYNANAAHTPCTSADHVWAGTITTPAAGTNPALVMPAVDYTYWWKNAMSGPNHFCTNSNPGLSANFFDNDAGTTSAPNNSLGGVIELTPTNSDYTCQVVVGGVLQGELSWNHTTGVLTVYGTIFIDGHIAFNDYGEVMHYHGRATIFAGGEVELGEETCAGGSGTSHTGACIASGMQNWDPSTNLLVLVGMANSEYDQYASQTCPSPNAIPNNHPENCDLSDGHPYAGFQGVLYAKTDCEIHWQFQDSGPVICNTITLPLEGTNKTNNPTYYTYPAQTDSNGNLTDGQTYSDPATATNFAIVPGAESQ